jgi:hypothetical protein
VQIAATSNVSTFKDRLAQIARGIRTSTEVAVRAYATALLQDLNHQSTPFRSGQARANWQVTINAPSANFIELPESVKSGVYNAGDVADALDHGLSVIASFSSGQTLYIANNAPYIVRLNNGSSDQAPAGFVEAAIAAASSIKAFGLIG